MLLKESDDGGNKGRGRRRRRIRKEEKWVARCNSLKEVGVFFCFESEGYTKGTRPLLYSNHTTLSPLPSMAWLLTEIDPSGLAKPLPSLFPSFFCFSSLLRFERRGKKGVAASHAPAGSAALPFFFF